MTEFKRQNSVLDISVRKGQSARINCQAIFLQKRLCDRRPEFYKLAMMTGWLCLGILLSGVAFAEESGPRQRGFVLTWFGMANHEGEDDCPEGLAIKTDEAAFMSTLREEEQRRLQLPQNAGEKYQRLAGRGPNGENVCEHPELAVEPPLRTVQGNSAYGLNLSNQKDGPKRCLRQPFEIGLNGEDNVDNQWYRVTGCQFGVRNDGPGGYVTRYRNNVMRDGNFTILLEIMDIDDPRNDDNVRVGIYHGKDPMVKDAQGTNILSFASIEVADDEHYNNALQGKIVDGVLIAEADDIFLYTKNGNPITQPEHHFRNARLRLELNEDGTAKGVLAGFHDWRRFWRSTSSGGGFSEMAGGFTCPAVYNAYKSMADAFPDPETGECTHISVAYLIEAIPAFVIHSEKQAGAEGGSGEGAGGDLEKSAELQ